MLIEFTGSQIESVGTTKGKSIQFNNVYFDIVGPHPQLQATCVVAGHRQRMRTVERPKDDN